MDARATAGGTGGTPVTGDHLALHVGSGAAQFGAAQEALHTFLETAGVSARAIYRTELAFEELVSNVVRHGYGGERPGLPPIDVSASVGDDEIVLTVEDLGPPFDPSQPVATALPKRIEEAKIGGLGLRLVHSVAQRIEYQRIADRNRVTVGIARN